MESEASFHLETIPWSESRGYLRLECRVCGYTYLCEHVVNRLVLYSCALYSCILYPLIPRAISFLSMEIHFTLDFS